MATKLNILNNPSALYVMAYGSGGNAPVSAAGVVDWSGWTSLGWHSRNGVVLSFESEIENETVANYSGPVARYIVGETAKIGVGIKKATLEQMQYALEGLDYYATGETGGAYSFMSFGSGEFAEGTEYSLGFQGISDSGNTLVVFAPKVMRATSLELNFKTGEKEIPHEFECYSDSNESLGNLIQIYEIA